MPVNVMLRDIEMENNSDSVKPFEPSDFENIYNGSIDESIESSRCSSNENIVEAVHEIHEKPKLKIILEPAVFLVYFAINLVSTIFPNQLLYQSCTNVFNYSIADCQPLLSNDKNTTISKQIDEIIQPFVAKITLTLAIIESILPAIVVLFIAPWSDKFGRRHLILGSFLAYFIYFLNIAIMVWIELKKQSSPWLYVLPVVSLALSGGACVMMTIIYCYITDVAHERLKGLSLMLNYAAMIIGALVGYLVSTPLFAATNTAVVACVAAIAMVFALLYAFFFAKETIPSEVSLWTKIRALFHYNTVVDLAHTCFLKHESRRRTYLCLTMLCFIITNFITAGFSNVFYSFLWTKFHITYNEYATYIAVDCIILVVCGIASIVVLRKFFEISINLLAVLSLACCLVYSIIAAAAQTFWELYLAAACGCLSGIITPMLLTLLSLTISSAEIGKIYALTMALQTAITLGAAPLYRAVYDATLSYYPGMFNIINIALYLLCLIVLVTIYMLHRRSGAKLD